MKPRDRELGLGRAITRRDFVNGVGLGLTGWGSHVGSFEVAHALTHGERWDEAGTGESYDLVVVGGGISGLSAAYLYQKQVGKDARILVAHLLQAGFLLLEGLPGQIVDARFVEPNDVPARAVRERCLREELGPRELALSKG